MPGEIVKHYCLFRKQSGHIYYNFRCIFSDLIFPLLGHFPKVIKLCIRTHVRKMPITVFFMVAKKSRNFSRPTAEWLRTLVAQMVKNPPAMQETWVQSLGWEDPLKKEWLPTPVLLPGEFHGQRNLVGYSPWGHKELETTEQLTLSLLSHHGITQPLK